jgi:hypothetical protein
MKHSLALLLLLTALLALAQSTGAIILRSGLNVGGVAQAKKKNSTTAARQLEPEIILRAGLNVGGVAQAKKKNATSTSTN